jgi:membrane-associated protease RseP (regulator of RpoE activity)
MTDSSNRPVPQWRPDSGTSDRSLRPDSVEWWTPRQGPPAPPEPIEPLPGRRIGRPNYLLHAVLFVLSCLTTTATAGPLYGATIMAILLAHEMGHYLMARHYKVHATLPYFIPMPISIFGTMGAVIRMASLGANRRVLFDIGMAGPIAGLVLAIPACLIGISMSEVVLRTSVAGNYVNLGSPLLFQWFSDLIKGPLPPQYDIQLHPIAFAGWAGMFVTALNLIPVGQLDGGHAAYALFGGRNARYVSGLAALGFVALAIFYTPQWLFLALLLVVFGLRHPPTGDDQTPIDAKRKLIGAVMLLLFVLLFTPRPFEM